MTVRITSTIPLSRAPLYQQLVKRHGLWFTWSSIYKDSFSSTVATDDMVAYNAFSREWDRTQQELNDLETQVARNQRELDKLAARAARMSASMWSRMAAWVRARIA